MPSAVTSLYACGAANCRAWVVLQRMARVVTSQVPTPPQVKEKFELPAQFLPGGARLIPTGGASERRSVTAVEVGRGCRTGERG